MLAWWIPLNAVSMSYPEIDNLIGVCWMDEGSCHDNNPSTLGQVRAHKIRCLEWIWGINMLHAYIESFDVETEGASFVAFSEF